MKYQIVKSFLGQRMLAYTCPGCNTKLRSPIVEAGQTDACPECNASFLVPGSDALQTYEKEQAEQKRVAAEETQQRKSRKQEEAKRRQEEREEAMVVEALKRSEARQAEKAQITLEGGTVATLLCGICREEIIQGETYCRNCQNPIGATRDFNRPTSPKRLSASKILAFVGLAILCGPFVLCGLAGSLIPKSRNSQSFRTQSSASNQRPDPDDPVASYVKRSLSEDAKRLLAMPKRPNRIPTYATMYFLSDEDLAKALIPGISKYPVAKRIVISEICPRFKAYIADNISAREDQKVYVKQFMDTHRKGIMEVTGLGLEVDFSR